jgi:DNA-binding MurR/RpiR family transcriptional regulator
MEKIDQGNLSGANFVQIIVEHYNDLTKSEKRIADYLVKNRDEAAFLSAGEIAKRLDLSEATMVRFARALGLESYPAFRAVLQEAFRRRVTHSGRLRSRLNDLREAGDVFEKLVVSEIDYLTQALETVDRNELKRAVELIQAHPRIFVFGLGPSISLVDLLVVRLTRSTKHVIPLKYSGREMLEPMLLMNESDLLITIGFYNLTPNLQIVLEHADKVKAPVILITDTLEPQVKNHVDVLLTAHRGPVSAYHSLTVPMTIINTLLLMLSQVDEENVMSNLDTLDAYRQRQIEIIARSE